MCGIIGIIGKAPVTPLLVEALKRLEYRGYDSAGVATLVNGHIERRRAEGKLVNLEARLGIEPLAGTIGIGHTRWATHGKPSERNAHPIATSRVAIVHNGIIENFQELKDELLAEGRRFESDTDTEVVAQLLTSYLERQLSPEEAMGKAMGRLRGAFALVALFSGRHDILMGARRGSSLAVGYGDGDGTMYIGTDALALAPFTKRVTYLEDDDWVVLDAKGATIFQGDKEVQREIRQSGISGAMMGKGNHRHFMVKEIYEQPAVIGDTLQTYLDPATRKVTLPALPFDWAKVSRLTITACGTACFAGMVAKYWFEKLARLPVEVEVASEFRYREPPLPEGGVCIAISQSGETIDTLAALRYAKAQKQTILSVVNVPESAIARESHVVLPTLAGPEIGVASTKAFTTQLTVLLVAAIAAGRARGVLSPEEEARLVHALIELPAHINEALNLEAEYKRVAEDILAEARDVLYLGRGLSFPIALEGALKLKEVSYIHAEGYAGGEMKHGPIALIDEAVPVVVVAPTDALFDKIASNFEQVKARGGKLVLLSDPPGNARLGSHAAAAISLPQVDPMVAPILYSVPVQLLAYYTAVAKGTDVDQPRNLAKSVTVE
jgi:glucosamine--fructose-6-phosphate aminotransferase (isomerizing)